jgi:hypothetical protein
LRVWVQVQQVPVQEQEPVQKQLLAGERALLSRHYRRR